MASNLIPVFSMTYNIKIPQFEGPFDLLLFFIERDELDIYNIPIAEITKDFLDYILQMEALNIDLASEFILVASTLMRIKAKLLLPRKDLDEQGNEIDPREELVQRLLEYKRYKAVMDEIRHMEEDRLKQEQRGNTAKELKDLSVKALVDVELESLSLYRLLQSFEKVMHQHEEANKKVFHTVIKYDYTVDGQRKYLIATMSEQPKADFENIFGNCENRIHAIFRFLALLELLQLQELGIVDGEGANNFWIIANNE